MCRVLETGDLKVLALFVATIFMLVCCISFNPIFTPYTAQPIVLLIFTSVLGRKELPMSKALVRGLVK